MKQLWKWLTGQTEDNVANEAAIALLNEYRQIEVDRLAKIESADGDVAAQLRDLRAEAKQVGAKLVQIEAEILRLGGN